MELSKYNKNNERCQKKKTKESEVSYIMSSSR